MRVHEEGKGAKYTRGRGPFSLVYKENLDTRGKALSREIEIKQLTRKQKEALFMKWRDRADDERTAKLSETN
jgi:putative endonuclease